MWQSELRTENPPSNPNQPAKQARTVHQALLLSAPATTGKPVCSAVTFSIIKERLGVCSAVSVFIETNDLIKFQFRSNPPRAKAARFFLSLLQESVHHFGNWRVFLRIPGRPQQNLKAYWTEYGDGSQRRRGKSTFHITHSPVGLRWIVFDDLLHLVNYHLRWEILTLTNSPDDSSPPASYINAKKTSDQTYTPKS